MERQRHWISLDLENHRMQGDVIISSKWSSPFDVVREMEIAD